MRIASRVGLPLVFLFATASTLLAQSPKPAKRKNVADPPPVTCQGAVPYFHFSDANKTVIPATAPATQTTIIYSARLLMGSPNGNGTECSVRQVLFFLPDDLANGLDETGNSAPVVQISIDSPDSIGYTEAMLPYSLQRVAGPPTEYVLDAQDMIQSPYTYYANITIIGHPKLPSRK